MLYLLSCRLCVLLPLLAVQIPIVLTDVTWDSPTAGDVYGPGDTLQAVWTSSDRVVSPSFTICTGADSNSTDANTNPDCGTAVWPLIKQNDTESSISFAIPNITGDGIYHLVMKDDTGTTYDTPSFSLARMYRPPIWRATDVSS
ncbi:hypothetical protein K439DRAFT_633423 [Ramaria rubella]|nr:hypothetical protein K439DRAFT_633423 [Ramaria rubella]